MRTIYLLSTILIFFGATACSNDDGLIDKNQSLNEDEHKKEIMAFQKSYNTWITTRVEMSKNGKSKEISKTNDLIIDQAYELLLSYGYDQGQLKKELKKNKNIIIAQAIQLYVNEKQVKF